RKGSLIRVSLTNTAKAATEIRTRLAPSWSGFFIASISRRQRRLYLDSDACFSGSGDAPACGVRYAARAALRRDAARVRPRLRDVRQAQRGAIECDPDLPRAERLAPC